LTKKKTYTDISCKARFIRYQRRGKMQCPICGDEIKTVPAGVSKKTGQPYNEFQVCSNRQCGFKPIDERGRKCTVVKPASPAPSGNNDQSVKSMILSYAKDLVVAEIRGGIAPPNIPKQTIAYFRELLAGYKE
jgi:predicted RNA-binding Zn-ribbon protein involved in translation (DUF1610 family)